MGRPILRHDVETQWTKEFDHASAKDALTPEKYEETGNGSEETGLRVAKPAMNLAEKLLQ